MSIFFFFLDLILSTELIPTTVVHVVLQVLQLQCINYNDFIEVDKSKQKCPAQPARRRGPSFKYPGPSKKKKNLS